VEVSKREKGDQMYLGGRRRKKGVLAKRGSVDAREGI